MKYLIIGTAGHVDHGKSALIKALTGVETDRLKEEKQRGISIDLGFASLKISDDIIAGIVDVPGHERFFKNMLAGTGGIDLALLVIAADEGVMPQTREHLAMLELYGLKNGIVVLNKVDKVDGEWLELVEEDVRNILKGTFLAASPFCRVSAVTGEGLLELKNKLGDLAARVEARDSNAPFRLWIDRVFSVKGHGVVVTGSALSGTAKLGDVLHIYPAEKTVRVRGLEWHGEKVAAVAAGQRSAINLAGIDIKNIVRGMLLSDTSRGESSSVWDVVVNWLEEVPTNTRVRLHIGTGEYLGRIYCYKNKPVEYCRLVLEQQLTAGADDRGILRLYSPRQLLGGVVLIAPGQKGQRLSEMRLAMAEAIANSNYKNIILLILSEAGKPLLLEEIMRRSGYIAADIIKLQLDDLLKENKAICLSGLYISTEILTGLTKKLKNRLTAYHKSEPDRQGLPREVLRQHLGLGEKGFGILYDYWQQKNLLTGYGAEIALTEHKANHSSWQTEIISKAEKVLAEVGLNTVKVTTIEQKFKISAENARKILEALIKSGLIVRVGDLYLTRMVIAEAIDNLQQHFKENQTVNVAQLRDILNTSRKIAMPLLEYFDGQKYTIREDDARRAGVNLTPKK